MKTPEAEAKAIQTVESRAVEFIEGKKNQVNECEGHERSGFLGMLPTDREKRESWGISIY